jgi:hypothetical protein
VILKNAATAVRVVSIAEPIGHSCRSPRKPQQDRPADAAPDRSSSASARCGGRRRRRCRWARGPATCHRRRSPPRPHRSPGSARNRCAARPGKAAAHPAARRTSSTFPYKRPSSSLRTRSTQPFSATRRRSLLPLPPLRVSVPNAVGEQPIQIGKVRFAVDEEAQAFAIVLARPLAVPRLSSGRRSSFGVLLDDGRQRWAAAESVPSPLQRPFAYCMRGARTMAKP